MDKSHSPHLALYKPDALEDAIRDSGEGDLMRTPGIVVGAIDELIPDFSIAIEGAITMASPVDVSAAKEPSTALILVAHRKGGVEPVWDVLVPKESASEVDVDI